MGSVSFLFLEPLIEVSYWKVVRVDVLKVETVMWFAVLICKVLKEFRSKSK